MTLQAASVAASWFGVPGAEVETQTTALRQGIQSSKSHFHVVVSTWCTQGFNITYKIVPLFVRETESSLCTLTLVDVPARCYAALGLSQTI